MNSTARLTPRPRAKAGANRAVVKVAEIGIRSTDEGQGRGCCRATRSAERYHVVYTVQGLGVATQENCKVNFADP
jgi:hypothetical protein